MAYTLPVGSAANFTVPSRKYAEPGAVRHAYQFPADTYVAPNPIRFVVDTYGYPAGSSAHFAVPAQPQVFVGVGAATVGVLAEGHGTHYAPVVGVGAATVVVSAEGHGNYTSVVIIGRGAVDLPLDATGSGRHGVKGVGAAAISVASGGTGRHGVRGSGEASVGVACSGAGTHVRYEVKGEVRIENILVNRLVRAYLRDNGALVGEAETVAGRFRIHTGFQPAEHYLIPVELAPDATDWAPPCANRVESVLAYD